MKLCAAVLLIVLTNLSGDVSANHLLSEQQLSERLSNAKEVPGATVSDRGTYLVVAIPGDNQFRVFTTAVHPAHPGIIELTILTNNGEVSLKSEGHSGANSAAFDEFQHDINRRFVEVLKRSMAGGN